MEHEGRAVVFENVEDLARAHRRRRPRRHGRRHPGAEEHRPQRRARHAGSRLHADPEEARARQGVKDMVRISDGRMSGTALGTIVLHVTPESAIGGPLAQVRTGDRIRLSVSKREISLLVSDDELARRAKRKNPIAPPTAAARLPQAVPASSDAGRPGRRLRFPAPR